MKKFNLVIGCMLLALSACDNEPHFTIKGNIADAKGETLYFETLGINNVAILDSVKLSSNGAYKFTDKRPESPEYYRLRINDKVINFSADSTETITIDAALADMTTNYIVKGSEESEKIKELTIKQMVLQQNVDKLLTSSPNLSPRAKQDSLMSLVDAYKADVKMNYVYTAPNKAHAYFAIFQKLGSYLIFDPYNSKEDMRCFQAVATSLNNQYPHSVRSKNLYNIVMRAMRSQHTPEEEYLPIPAELVSETSIIDIQLKDIKGNVHKLTDLKGKVVLLDFTIYQHAASAPRNLALREIYDKYSKQGLEIYQISLDADEHYWKTTADNLPWICVRDEMGIYSQLMTIYNIQNLPSFFLVSRSNELVLRVEAETDIEAEIKKLL